ncbi:MAG: hypothetical protein AABX19_01390 [Nanoarchaeota archaeon]
MRYNYNNSLVQQIVKSVFNLHNDVRYKPANNFWALPKGSLSRSDTYVVTGRDYKGTEFSENEPGFISGNPIDIIGSYISADDYYSYNRNGNITDNVYSNRRLILASELKNRSSSTELHIK